MPGYDPARSIRFFFFIHETTTLLRTKHSIRNGAQFYRGTANEFALLHESVLRCMRALGNEL
jgi:hypothetical protein